jgi:uncharacterized protein Veg
MSLTEVKDNITDLKGKLLDIKINKGRKKIVKCVGEVVDIYPSVFTMRINGDESGVLSCSYSDIICGTVSLQTK